MNSVQKPIKVYVITGFLGAGKTTLLNRLLEAKKKERNVVIENEFGKISTVVRHIYESTNIRPLMCN